MKPVQVPCGVTPVVVEINALAQESHRAVGHAEVGAAGVFAAEADEGLSRQTKIDTRSKIIVASAARARNFIHVVGKVSGY